MKEIEAELERLLGESPGVLRPISGGDIGDSFRLSTKHGKPGGSLFVKAYPGGSGSEMVAAEARGLTWLAEPAALRVPRVRAASLPGESMTPLLVLEWIEPGAPQVNTDEQLGRGLARLHRAGAPHFGLADGNFIGRLPQSNRRAETWTDFYRDRRLSPLIERARVRGLLPADLDAAAATLLDRLPELVGPTEAPARLHGDLWGGNWLCASDGEPVLIDPAAYGGHREIDLAMMRLFGGFSDRVFSAYAEAFPLAAGHAERVDLYQLYPLLVHLNLFGASYADGVARAIRSYL